MCTAYIHTVSVSGLVYWFLIAGQLLCVEFSRWNRRWGNTTDTQDQDPRSQTLLFTLQIQPRLHVSVLQKAKLRNSERSVNYFLFFLQLLYKSVHQCFQLFVRLLATCSADQTCKIWRTSNFSLMTELSIKSNNPGETSRGWMWDCAFSGDSQYIVTGEHTQHTQFKCLSNTRRS